MPNKKKHRCHLGLYADGATTGETPLTKEEYKLVKRVTDTRNWKMRNVPRGADHLLPDKMNWKVEKR